MRVAALLLLVIAAWPARARAQVREPVVVIGLRPATGSVDGPSDLRRLSEAQKLRKVADDAVRVAAHRPIIDDAGMRTTLGVEYLVDFMDCRGAVRCVARLVAKLKKTAPTGVYGDYAVVDKSYRFRVRLLDLVHGKVVKVAEFKLDEPDIQDRKLWQRELEPLFGEAGTEPEATPPTAGDAAPETPPPPSGGESPPNPPSDKDAGAGVPELPPISNGEEGASTSTPAAATTTSGSASGAYIDNSVLDAISRGIIWHGHFQNYTAMGVYRDFSKDIVTFDDRLQLEFESDISPVRVIGKPQLLFNVIDNKFELQFREIYAARDYKRVDISVGDQIMTWGITDFWPVVDIINPRTYAEIKNWRPIDEKLPVPLLKTTWLFGPLTFHLIGIPILGRSEYQLDQTKPFALPIPAPPGATIEQHKAAANLSNAGGGARIDVAIAAWKLSLYGLVGRDPLPSVYVDTDPMTGASTFVVDNDRVLMAASSLQGNIDVLGAILKAEAAFYHRLDDACRDKTADLGGIPECLYLHRVPTGRANIALERRILPGLEAHVQFISEYTRPADVPRLPDAIKMLAPGLPEQYEWNRILTLRLQGSWAGGDFAPMAFIYYSMGDEAFFANVDLDYHLADGFALALGGFWFQGIAKDSNKNQYTLAGSMGKSSNVYLRATAWF